jgi:hypothetical protein
MFVAQWVAIQKHAAAISVAPHGDHLEGAVTKIHDISVVESPIRFGRNVWNVCEGSAGKGARSADNPVQGLPVILMRVSRKNQGERVAPNEREEFIWLICSIDQYLSSGGAAAQKVTVVGKWSHRQFADNQMRELTNVSRAAYMYGSGIHVVSSCCSMVNA